MKRIRTGCFNLTIANDVFAIWNNFWIPSINILEQEITRNLHCSHLSLSEIPPNLRLVSYPQSNIHSEIVSSHFSVQPRISSSILKNQTVIIVQNPRSLQWLRKLTDYLVHLIRLNHDIRQKTKLVSISLKSFLVGNQIHVWCLMCW